MGPNDHAYTMTKMIEPSRSISPGDSVPHVKVDSDMPSPLAASTSSENSQSQNGHTLHGVPNPFANTTTPSPTLVSSAPQLGWTVHSNSHYDSNSQQTNSIPMVVSTPGAPHNGWQVQREVSCPNFSLGTADPTATSRKTSAGGRRRYGKAASDGVNDTVNARRQKRLERNRESARLSRRRRKQYLEILEDRVTQLSREMDMGRREHVARAVQDIESKRKQVVNSNRSDEEKAWLLGVVLSRTSPEMMLATTFKTQQLKSFVLAPHTKFTLWLTLQSDDYFRGGRAASERLSAARIGERMLQSGTDRVPPAQSMWPLFCNEVGLSYDQEERVRAFQRTLLQSPNSWLERHTARASGLVMDSTHDATQAMTMRVGQRLRSMMEILTPAQRVRLSAWSDQRKGRVKQQLTVKRPVDESRHPYQIVKEQHVAANLYIMNHRLRKILETVPIAAPLATGAALKRLSRRPSFESLGRVPDEKEKMGRSDSMEFDKVHNSNENLKRSESSLSMDDGERPHFLQISPEEAQATASFTVEKALSHIKEIIPPPPLPQFASHPHMQPQPADMRIPSPAPVRATGRADAPGQIVHPAPHSAPQLHVVPSLPPPLQHPGTLVEAQPVHAPQENNAHNRQSSFIPPYLNVVPEEMFPADATTDDILMSLVDGDWHIGEGIDMESG